MRKFIRHPSDIPITYKHGKASEFTKENLKDIGHGGLCFRSKNCIETGTTIIIKIDIHKPPFEAEGIVSWCQKANKHYEIGVTFADAHTEFGVRMVEQACYIEHYKRKVLRKEGRFISGKEAALEWVDKNAVDFPR